MHRATTERVTCIVGYRVTRFTSICTMTGFVSFFTLCHQVIWLLFALGSDTRCGECPMT